MLYNKRGKDKLPVLKLEQSTAKGFEMAGASLSQCCNESPGKLHDFTPERGKLTSGDQYLEPQVSKFHRNWETIQ